MKNSTKAKKWKEKKLKGKAGKIAIEIAVGYDILDSSINDSLLERYESAFCRKNNIEYEAIRGEWNGYGCPVIGQKIKSCEKATKITNKIIENLKKEFKKCKKIVKTKESNRKSPYELWINRLIKLTGINREQAKNIANEKLEYQQDRIDMMNERECNNPSHRRMKLIAKMERENPLRRIVDEEHAQAILSASDRHNNTNYENELEEAREQAQLGMIDRSEIKEVARMAI